MSVILSMKVRLGINNIPIINKLRSDFKPSFGMSPQILTEDIFESSDTNRIKGRAEQILSQKRKFGIDDYEKLSSEEKILITETSEKHIKNAAASSVRIAQILKNNLDKTYGEDNYVFCSIGTSPAGIARVFEFMGVETKYLPISGIKYDKDFDIDNLNNPDFRVKHNIKLNNYSEYIESLGLTNESMNESGKKYLFFDYTSTGSTLNGFERMVKEVFGVNNQNMKFISINKYLDKISTQDEKTDVVDYVISYMFRSRMQMYSGIHSLYWKNIADINQHQFLNTGSFAKRFNVLVMQELENLGLLKNNSKNKRCL